MNTMIKHAIANWKTTSTGLTMLVGAIVHLIFQIKSQNANENTWTIALGAIIGGVGLIFAGDAGKSVQKTDVQTDSETGFLKKSATAPPETPPSTPKP